MAGYSNTPLPRKLGLKPGLSVALLHAPSDFEQTLHPVPEGVTFRRNPRTPCDLAIWFVESKRDLAAGLRRARRVMGAGLWNCWRKKASGRQTDLGEALVRETALADGLVDYKICALDDTWSGLKFAVQR